MNIEEVDGRKETTFSRLSEIISSSYNFDDPSLTQYALLNMFYLTMTP